MDVAVKGNPRESTQAQRLPKEKETVRGAPSFLGVRHVGLLAKEPASLAVFYRDVMGMQIVRQTPPNSALGAIAFIALHPEEEDHDIVFVSNAAIAHTAFRVASLGDLLAFYRKIKDHGVPIRYCLNHIVELAFYFEDPEGHVIEIYWATGLPPVPDVHAEPIDLEVPEERLRREVERLAAHYGT
jgi:catechol-2,3-dioxygenase